MIMTSSTQVVLAAPLISNLTVHLRLKTTKCVVEVAATTKRKMLLQLRPGIRKKRSTSEGRRESRTNGTLMTLLAWRMSSMRIILLPI
jgi:hypothetical protein